jgi:hypothetical protein
MPPGRINVITSKQILNLLTLMNAKSPPAMPRMNIETARNQGKPLPGEQLASKPSRLMRRLHMYLGLFLAPWMLMYALSTIGMSHRDFFLSYYPTKAPRITTEREMDYSRAFPPGADPNQMAREILRDLGLDGSHRVSGGKDGKPLVVNRQHSRAQRRITYDPATKKVLVQREEFRLLTFLERMHRRRGYQHPYALEDSWAFSVDLTVITMIFWSLSGLWLWWEMRSPDSWGDSVWGLECWCLPSSCDRSNQRTL